MPTRKLLPEGKSELGLAPFPSVSGKQGKTMSNVLTVDIDNHRDSLSGFLECSDLIYDETVSQLTSH